MFRQIFCRAGSWENWTHSRKRYGNFMIEADKRKAIYLLHKEGMGVREISRNMNISTNTVTAIIDHAGELPQTTRKDKIDIDADPPPSFGRGALAI